MCLRKNDPQSRFRLESSPKANVCNSKYKSYESQGVESRRIVLPGASVAVVEGARDGSNGSGCVRGGADGAPES